MSAIEELLERHRARLKRLTAHQAHTAQRDGALLVDTRPAANRLAEGTVPGAVVIERNVLEWRLDPTSPHRIPQANTHERRIILFCNEGYASSLAATQLQDLGLKRATDLIGGYRAWTAAGLPTLQAGEPDVQQPTATSAPPAG